MDDVIKFRRDDDRVEHDCCWSSAIVRDIRQDGKVVSELLIECDAADADMILARLLAGGTDTNDDDSDSI